MGGGGGKGRLREVGRCHHGTPKNTDRIQSAATTGDVSFVAHVGKIPMQIIARHLSEYFEREGILPEEQSGSLPKCFTADMMLVISWLSDLARKKRIPFYV